MNEQSELLRTILLRALHNNYAVQYTHKINMHVPKLMMNSSLYNYLHSIYKVDQLVSVYPHFMYVCQLIKTKIMSESEQLLFCAPVYPLTLSVQ